VADWELFLRRTRVPGQGKGEDEKGQRLHFLFLPDLAVMFQAAEGTNTNLTTNIEY
jgi:hypothetical protein